MQLHIRVVEAKDVPKMDVFGKADPYCLIQVSSQRQVYKTKVIKKTYTPVWNQEFHVPILDIAQDSLHILMKDEDKGKADDPISRLQIKVGSLVQDAVTDKWYDMIPVEGVKKGGKLRLVLHLAVPGAIPFKPNTAPGQFTTGLSSMVNANSNFLATVLPSFSTPQNMPDQNDPTAQLPQMRPQQPQIPQQQPQQQPQRPPMSQQMPQQQPQQQPQQPPMSQQQFPPMQQQYQPYGQSQANITPPQYGQSQANITPPQPGYGAYQQGYQQNQYQQNQYQQPAPSGYSNPYATQQPQYNQRYQGYQQNQYQQPSQFQPPSNNYQYGAPAYPGGSAMGGAMPGANPPRPYSYY